MNASHFWTFEYCNKYLFSYNVFACVEFFCRLDPQTPIFCSDFEYIHSGSTSSTTHHLRFAGSSPRSVKWRSPRQVWEHWMSAANLNKSIWNVGGSLCFYLTASQRCKLAENVPGFGLASWQGIPDSWEIIRIVPLSDKNLFAFTFVFCQLGMAGWHSLYASWQLYPHRFGRKISQNMHVTFAFCNEA